MAEAPDRRRAIVGLAIYLATLVALAATLIGAAAAEPRCTTPEAWAHNAPLMLEFVDQCGPRQWWRRLDNDWRVYLVREVDGLICVMGEVFTPRWRQQCPDRRVQMPEGSA